MASVAIVLRRVSDQARFGIRSLLNRLGAMVFGGMGVFGAYVVRTVLHAFLLVLLSLTGVIWITQALRGIDLMTSQGQTILIFLGISSLAIPLLALLIAPIAFVIAVAHTLNKLATDSEIIVMNAAGMSPLRLLRPFLYAAAIVSILLAFLSLYLAPESLRSLRQWRAQISADVLANVVQPGQFIELGKLTLRVRERRPGGVLVGVFVDDQRNPAERIDISADHGTVRKTANGTFLILEDGNLQRLEAGKRDPAIVAFKSYAFDLSQFSNSGGDVSYTASEQFTSELISPAPGDPHFRSTRGQMRVELHNRIVAPLYAFVFALMGFAFLGLPRTTRQGRSFAIVSLILAVLAVRIGGFACSAVAPTMPAAIYLQYVLLAVIAAVCLKLIAGAVVIDAPAKPAELFASFWNRLSRRPRQADSAG